MPDNPDTVRAVVFSSADGFRFRLVAKANGEIVSQSEAYVRREDAGHEAEQIVGVDDVTYE